MLVWAIIAAFPGAIASAQVQWSITGAVVLLDGEVYANEHDATGAGTWDIATCFENVLTPGFLGHDFGVLCWEYVEDFQFAQPSRVAGVIYGFVYLDGDNTSEMTIRWANVAGCDSVAECYDGWAVMDLVLLLDLTITGGPPGEPVIVYYYWDAFGGGMTDHECPGSPSGMCGAPGVCPPLPPAPDDEDPVSADNTLEADGIDVLAGRFTFASPPGIPGWSNKTNQQGLILAQVGDTIFIDVLSTLDVEINPPGRDVTGSPPLDRASASFQGALRITVGFPTEPAPPPPPLDPVPISEFSIDLGSDTELSDPNVDGDERFDPGDCYLFDGPLLAAGGEDGFRDDADIFIGVDVWPDPPDGPPPITGVPMCPAPFDPSAWFDLDGHDNLDVSLAPFLGPILGPIEFFDSECIYRPDFLIISYDDDGAENYSGAACEIPLASGSPYNAVEYGTTAGQDEIIGVFTVGAAFSSTVLPIFIYPGSDELGVHPSLGPNPDFVADNEDDDVDSLDVTGDPAICNFLYFSPDHEATSFDPNTGLNLDAGDIYEVVAGGPPVLVVDEVFHLGISDETDIDAFEFVWIIDPISGGPHLALLYSVDDDDPLTAGDESGGLNPAMLYASFFDGASFEYLTTPLLDDVDALTVWKTDLLPASNVGACCDVFGCTERTSLACSLISGSTYRGDGTDCADINQNGEADECECLTCRGDLNGDLAIDGLDIQMFADCLAGSAGASNCGCADIDANGTLDMNDLNLFVFFLLYGSGAPCP